MVDLYAAYFVGGPFDMTKRIVDKPLSIVRMAEFMNPYVELHAEIPIDTPMRVCEYRLVTNVRGTPDPDGREVLIYCFEEARNVQANNR